MKIYARAHLLSLTLLTLASAACRAGWDDAPPPPPGQACNALEHWCPTGRGCCGNEDTCGGEPASVGCPADSCCPVLGSPTMNVRAADAGTTSRPMRHP